jgi:chemotaxis protein CheX
MEAATTINSGAPSSSADMPSGLQSGGALNRLPQILDFTQAQNLRDTVAALLGDGALVLDASAVERMSTPCAQVLLATGHAADSAGTSFEIRDASEVFRAALADLGLQTESKNWMV